MTNKEVIKMTVTVMSRDGKESIVFEGDMRVSKSTIGDKWLVVKDIEDDVIINKYPVDKYYIILN